MLVEAQQKSESSCRWNEQRSSRTDQIVEKIHGRRYRQPYLAKPGTAMCGNRLAQQRSAVRELD